MAASPCTAPRRSLTTTKSSSVLLGTLPPAAAAPSTAPSSPRLLARRLSLPDLRRLKDDWDRREKMQPSTLPPGRLQIDLLNVRSDVKVKRPLMRLRMGSQHYYSSRSKDADGHWNEGFQFTVSYHNQLFDTIEFDLYDKRKGWRSKTRHIGKAKLKLSRLKNRDPVFLTFLPMYEYHVRRYLPAHIQLPHNFLRTHIPRLQSAPRRSVLHCVQHPSHSRHSMTPFIGSVQVRVRYCYQLPPDATCGHKPPVYLPHNRTKDFDSFSFASTLARSSTASSFGACSTSSTDSTDTSTSVTSCNSTTTKSDSDHYYHDAVEPRLVYIDDSSQASPLRSQSTLDLIFEQRLQRELAQPVTPNSTNGSTDPTHFGFSRRDTDSKRADPADKGESVSDASSIRSRNFGDKNFAFRWMNESFEEVALSHPSLDRMIGLVVSPQTRILLRAVVKMVNAFGQGFKITTLQLLSSLTLLQNFYTELPRSPPAEKITDLRFLDEGYYFLGHAIIAYGWRGISYLGDYAKYLKDVMKTKSNKEAIVRFLKIPQEDLLGYEYGLRKGAVFQPSYFVSVDRAHEAIVLGIRGTWSLYDCITDLVCEYRPWKGGLVHSGMLASAQWFFTHIIPQIFHYVHEQAGSPTRPISSFIITGHSLGAGTAAILTMMVVDHLAELCQLSANPAFRVHCYSYAPVASVSLDLSEKYKGHIDSFVCHDDLVARLSYGTATCTKELIMDALTAANGLGGMNKVTSDPAIKDACFDILKARRAEIFHANEPRYPLLYIPGQVSQFRRSSTRSLPPGTRPRAQSTCRSDAKTSKLPNSLSEPTLPGVSVDGDSNTSVTTTFTLHRSSPLISEEVYVSKTCLEDHMVVTYLNAFQMVRQDCMRRAAATKRKDVDIDHADVASCEPLSQQVESRD